MNKNTTPPGFNYFDNFFNNSANHLMLLMNERGTIAQVNTAFTNYLGYGKEDIIGKSLDLLFIEDDRKKSNAGAGTAGGACQGLCN